MNARMRLQCIEQSLCPVDVTITLESGSYTTRAGSVGISNFLRKAPTRTTLLQSWQNYCCALAALQNVAFPSRSAPLFGDAVLS